MLNDDDLGMEVIKDKNDKAKYNLEFYNII